jgi:LysM repeat protein
VQSGHTLSAIAQAYSTNVSAIKKANNLKSDNIYVGQKLFIPE